jgi:uncharacterized protein YhaN
VKLRAISIERLAGLPHGLRLGPEHLDGHVRVIHGPNAIGKSSIVRALRALLWPLEAPTEGSVHVEARFDIDGVEWAARRDGERTNWFRDGSPVGVPQLPAWSQSSQMLVDLDALALGEEVDIQAHLQRELRGGYDVLAVEDAKRPTKQVGLAQSRELAAAEKALRAARDAQGIVLRDAARLDTLRHELQVASAASRSLRGIEAALERSKSQRQLQLLQADLAEYPDKIELLQGNELDELKRVRIRLQDARARISEARREEARVAAEIAELRLVGVIPETVLGELEDRVDALRDAETPLRTAEPALAKAAVREARAIASFGPGADIDRLADFDSSLERLIEELAGSATALAERSSRIQAELAVVGVTASVAQPDARAVAALEDWLETTAAPITHRRARTFLLVLAGLLLVLAIALAFVHIALASLSVLAVLALYGARSAPTARGPSRVDHEAAFSRTAEDPPASWTVQDVRAHLNALRIRAAEAAHAHPRALRRRELEGMLEIAEGEARDLAQRREGLAARLGETAQSPERLLVAVANARREVRDARGEHREREAECVRLRTARAKRLAELNEAMRPLGVAEIFDLLAAGARVKDLRSRSAQLVGLHKDRVRQAEMARQAQEDVETSEADSGAIYHRAGLHPGDEEGLRGRLGKYEDWKAARARRDEATRDVERLGRDADPGLADKTPEEIEGLLANARVAAEPAEELARTVTQIETRVQVAQEGRSLEHALADRNASRAALEAAFTQARSGAFACLLLADVRTADAETGRPKIIEDAADLFASFTRKRYTLRTETVEGRFVLKARDTQDSAVLQSLDQLSEGTRAQLLLAVRLAYLREIEHGNPLPVVLDDALATSDPERMREIGAALLVVARKEGRQFLVLTKDASDVDLLRPADAKPGEVEATDLGELRGDRIPRAAREALRIPHVPRVPDPAGRTAEEYAVALDEARMGVRSIDPHRPIDEVHLWWVLIHDLGLLARLLAMQIDSVGVFRNAQVARVPIPGAPERTVVEPWIELTTATLEGWRIGRGCPIDRDALENSKVSDRFIGPLAQLAADTGHDAKALIASIEAGHELARGFGRVKLDQLRSALIEKNYLDTSSTLTTEQAWLRVLGSMPTGHTLGVHEMRERFELLWRECMAKDATSMAARAVPDAS